MMPRTTRTIAVIASLTLVPLACDACICPRGDTVYLRVPLRDVDDLLRLGYRRQSPRPFR